MKKIGNKEFDKKFDELCRIKKEEKIKKKEVFNENIKDRLVIMDEYGNVTPKNKHNNHIDSSKHNTESTDNTKIILIGFFIIVYFIIMLSKMI